MTFGISGDKPVRTLLMNTKFDGTFEMQGTKQVEFSRLSYVVTDQVGTYTILIGKVGRQIHVVESKRHSDGKVMIKDGRFEGGLGKPTVLLTKCGS